MLFDDSLPHYTNFMRWEFICIIYGAIDKNTLVIHIYAIVMIVINILWEVYNWCDMILTTNAHVLTRISQYSAVPL